jgi:cytochrome c biogenesis protein ResB
MKIKLLKYLADLRFAISILLIISFCSIIGTVIEQDQSLEIYKLNYPITNNYLGFYLGKLLFNLVLTMYIKHGGFLD